MKYKTRQRIKRTSRNLLSIIPAAIKLVVRTVGFLLLILITTVAMLACIFVFYIKTNLLTTDLGVTFEEISLNQTSIIYAMNNETGEYEELVSLQSTEGTRYWVDYGDIPLDLEHALVAIEDQRFYQHHGVDWFRTSGAFVNMFLGMKDTFGGSTITQQLIKNTKTEDEDSDSQRTVRVKLEEIFRALEVEKKYEKWEIITWYLNVVYFGHGNQGIGAAAKYYFDKDVQDLTLAEMCSIVGITNNPSMYSPRLHPEANKERQELILDKMYEQGYITEAERDAAKAEELNFAFKRENSDAVNTIYTWFEETVIDDVEEYFMESREISSKTAETLLLNGGFQIYTTIDLDIQAKVDSIYENMEEIPETYGSSQQLQSSMVIIDPYTGNIVALAGAVGTKNANLLFNYATDAKRPPGSSIKPIAVYAPAINMGLVTPDTYLEDSPLMQINGRDWPYNDGRTYSYSLMTVRQGVIQSKNTISARTLDLVTPAASYSFLTNTLQLDLEPSDEDYAPLALGQLTYGLTTRDMAQSYCMFVNGGMFIESRTFTEIRDTDGNLVYLNVPETHVAIEESTAYWVTSMLQDAATSGTGSAANLGTMPTAGKTGTSGSTTDKWFVGYTPYYVAACWCGYNIPETIHISNGNSNPSITLWRKVMSLVHQNLEYKEFTTYENIEIEDVQVVDSYPYYIRGLAVDGEGGVTVLYEQLVDWAVEGRTVTVTANEVEGYTLVGDSTAELYVSSYTEDNVAEFIYHPIETETEPEDENPENGDETPPDNGNGDETPPDDGNGEDVPPETGIDTPPEDVTDPNTTGTDEPSGPPEEIDEPDNTEPPDDGSGEDTPPETGTDTPPEDVTDPNTTGTDEPTGPPEEME